MTTEVHPHTYGGTLLSIQNVNLTFDGGKTHVLRDFCGEIKDVQRPGCKQGQVVAIMGPSGVGKTQLFRILAGQNKPTSGKVTATFDDLPVREGLMGVVPQGYVLFKHRTVWGNLMTAGKQGGMTPKDAEEKAMTLLERFKIAHRKDAYPKALSGGQRQRVSIIRQLMCSENFLLMDEPTAALDPENKDEVCELVTEVASLDELMTIIVVTHDISAAIQMADTIWLMGRNYEEDGTLVTGAFLKYSFDLIERGLAWRHHITETPEFAEMRNEVRRAFRTL